MDSREHRALLVLRAPLVQTALTGHRVQPALQGLLAPKAPLVNLVPLELSASREPPGPKGRRGLPA